jgi:hypothetical protein
MHGKSIVPNEVMRKEPKAKAKSLTISKLC